MKKTIRVLLSAALIASATSSAIARDNGSPLSAARLSTVPAPGLQSPGKILIDVWAFRISMPRTSTICFSCKALMPRATGSGRSISGASAASACSPRISVRPMSNRTRLCGNFFIAAT
jgi:hypothetical protein